jgi:ABC-2 type transport system permease protein
MKQIRSLAKKEFMTFFSGPVGYVFSGLFLLVSLGLYWQDFFVIGLSDLGGLWGNLLFLMAFFVPAIGMGLIADEKKRGTWETLLSLPIKERELILGKFGGAGMFLLMTIALFLPTVASVAWLGGVDWGVVAGSFLGIILLAWSFLATTLLASAVFENGVVAFLTSMIFLTLNGMLGGSGFLSRLPVFLREIVAFFSLSSHFSALYSGVIRLTDVLFFVSYIFIFLMLSTTALKTRND